ncbi:MAG: RNA methyltransferase [Rubrivivax sp.]|nr:RNA methyltransferase [Rubrivivax sp.]
MSLGAPRLIVARDNPLVQTLRRLAEGSGTGRAAREQGQVWLEGDHLCRAAQARGRVAQMAVFSESAWASGRWSALAGDAAQTVLLADKLFAHISHLPSPAGVGWLLTMPPAPVLEVRAATVVLDRVQDAGNVGSILRSAAAFGIRQVIALKGTASLWSPKVLRAGMGAHFGLALFDAAEPSLLDSLELPLLAASSHAEHALSVARLPWPAAWVFGHEGQGVTREIQARCLLTLRIPQPGGEESLNVAAAAAVCLYESVRR